METEAILCPDCADPLASGHYQKCATCNDTGVLPDEAEQNAPRGKVYRLTF